MDQIIRLRLSSVKKLYLLDQHHERQQPFLLVKVVLPGPRSSYLPVCKRQIPMETKLPVAHFH